MKDGIRSQRKTAFRTRAEILQKKSRHGLEKGKLLLIFAISLPFLYMKSTQQLLYRGKR